MIRMINWHILGLINEFATRFWDIFGPIGTVFPYRLCLSWPCPDHQLTSCCLLIAIWGFTKCIKMRVPPNHQFLRGFPIIWGTPITWKSPYKIFLYPPRSPWKTPCSSREPETWWTSWRPAGPAACDPRFFWGLIWRFRGLYPLVNVYIAIENHHF